MGHRESDQMKFIQIQFENVKQENTRIDEQITNINHQCKQYQNQMEVCLFILRRFQKYPI
jgi:conjugal transfer/entry exclusion protein